MNVVRMTRIFSLLGLVITAAVGFSTAAAQAFHGGDSGSNCYGTSCSLSPSYSSLNSSGYCPSYTDLSSFCPSWCSFPLQPTVNCAPQTGYAPITYRSYQPLTEYVPVCNSSSVPTATYGCPACATRSYQPTSNYLPAWYTSGHPSPNFNLKK